MKLSPRHIAILPMLGALMFAATFVMKLLPNVHLLGVFIIVITRVYRRWALIPIYIYVFLELLIQGFTPWWIPYLYIWTLLWAGVMLLPRHMPAKAEAIVFCLMGFLHGVLFGALWAPAQALLFGLDFRRTVAWILSGIPFDIIHGVSNAVCCTLSVPLIKLFTRLEREGVRY